jgi:hypothetical protein
MLGVVSSIPSEERRLVVVLVALSLLVRCETHLKFVDRPARSIIPDALESLSLLLG